MTTTRSEILRNSWALLPLRVLVGSGFAAHGYAKLSRGPAQFSVILTAIGVPLPHVMAWITSLLEFVGGISIMAGAFVVPVSVPLIVVVLTAMFSVHWQYGFSSVRLKAVTATGAEFGPVGYEINLFYVVALLTLAACGSGKLSVDYWLSRKKKPATGTGLTAQQTS